jgi:hypothetical protein
MQLNMDGRHILRLQILRSRDLDQGLDEGIAPSGARERLDDVVDYLEPAPKAGLHGLAVWHELKHGKTALFAVEDVKRGTESPLGEEDGK